MSNRRGRNKASGATNTLRIIGGHWRGRRIEFPDNPGLRPTGDRIRETLFNWLQTDVAHASCLDLFAGSGVMGFEAASRGAASVVLIDSSPVVVKSLQVNCENLGAGKSVRIIQSAALDFLQQNTQLFDIVFLDPPFSSDLLIPCLQSLSQSACLKPESKIYIEFPKDFSPGEYLALNWQILKEKKAGQVKFNLLSVIPE